MNPPKVYEVTRPNSHKMSRITASVQSKSIMAPFSERSQEDCVLKFATRLERIAKYRVHALTTIGRSVYRTRKLAVRITASNRGLDGISGHDEERFALEVVELGSQALGVVILRYVDDLLRGRDGFDGYVAVAAIV
jgi:hypothetical protein